jgi:hypothetical protein
MDPLFFQIIAHAIHEISCTYLIMLYRLKKKKKQVKINCTKYLRRSSCMVCELGGITLCAKRAKQKQ